MSELLPNNNGEDGNKKYNKENRLETAITSDNKRQTLQDHIDNFIKHRETTTQLIITVFKDKQYDIIDVTTEQIVISDKSKSVQPPVLIKVQPDFGLQTKDERHLNPKPNDEINIRRNIQIKIEKELKKGR